jgi:hypothetical protein
MTTLKPDPGHVLAADLEAEPEVIDWLPGTSSAIAWNVAGIVVTVVGLVLFTLPVMLRSGSVSGSFQLGLVDILLVVGLTALLMVLHEALHGLVMRVFGGRPTFGAMLVGHVLPALYTTADGHQFTRNQYLVVAATPAVAISVLGFIACFGPWAAYLIVPLAIHLGGCVGDGFAVLRALREPPTTTCEDLRDGIRFHRTGAAVPALREG